VRVKWNPIVGNFAVIVFVTLCLTIALLDGPTRAWLDLVAAFAQVGDLASVIVRVILAAAAVTAVVVVVLRSRRKEGSRADDLQNRSNIVGRVSADSPFGESPSIRELFEAVFAVEGKFYDEVIALYGSMLVDKRYRLRTLERFSLLGSHSKKTIRTEYVLDAIDKEQILARSVSPLPGSVNAVGVQFQRSTVMVVPLMMVRKGSLLPDLTITDGRGHRLSELSRQQTIGLNCLVLASYFALTFDNVVHSEPEDERFEFSDDAANCLWRLRQLISYEGIVGQVDFLREFESAIAELPVKSAEKLASFRNLCLYFAENYYMACEVPMPQGFSVAIEMSTDVEIASYPATGEDRIRNFFGMEPYRYKIPLDLASTTPSYHAELDGGERSQYVVKQELVESKSQFPVDDDYFGGDVKGQVIYQSEPTRVSPRVNIRNFSHPKFPQLQWNVSVGELPPGALGPVTVLSILTTLLTFIFAFLAPSFRSEDFEAPALIVAIPIFAVTFFGFSYEKIARSSLTAMLGFVASSVIVVICATLVLLSSHAPLGVVTNVELLGFWKIGDFSGPLIFVALFSLCVMINLVLVTTRRTKRYHAFLRTYSQ
jgi:hypothetical protein